MRGGVGEAMKEMVARALTICAKDARSYTHACNRPARPSLCPGGCRHQQTHKLHIIARARGASLEGWGESVCEG